MLGKIASARQNGQFRTPRHIIQLLVKMTAHTPTDIICDPASGTCGFLAAAGEYLCQEHPTLFHDAKLNKHFNHAMFHGYDFDNTMLRIDSARSYQFRRSIQKKPARRAGSLGTAEGRRASA
jgi:type I restriction enzyme M protein